MPSAVRRRALLLASAAALLSPAVALAQVASPAPADAEEPAEVEEIVVTGSRLATGSTLASPLPITVVSAETLESQGAVQVVDVLGQVPSLIASESSAQANGTAPTLDLRGLGDNRTLVLVNGRRHVAGNPGSAAVDISSIPSSLIERVDVLTGGASAVYGSDAVTGVVNFILKRDYEGQEFTLQTGLSGQGDSPEIFGSFLIGRNFADGRGNVAFAVEGYDRRGIDYGDRDFSRDNNRANNYPNPALFFQQGDPLPPGQRALGRTILAGGVPRFAGTDPALVARAQGAAARAFINDPRFDVSNIGGLIGFDLDGSGFSTPARFFSTTQDLDRDGISDCQESRAGREGYGCYVIDQVTGRVRPFVDGIYAGSINQSGGDGAQETFNASSLTPDEKQVAVNLLLNYEVSPAFQPYAELKAVMAQGSSYAVYNTFDDSIPISPDNPFIPAEIRQYLNAEIAADPSIADVAKVLVGRDNIDLFDPRVENDRRTYRGVVGARGELPYNLSYDVSLNYGRTEGESRSAQRLEDRYFAAIDAVRNPATGEIVCRSTLDPTALPLQGQLGPNPGAPVPFNTFNPRDGSCRPLNLFGLNSASPEALAFQRYISEDSYTIEQTVLTGVLQGDSEALFSLPGGPVGFVIGAEYREEKSDFDADPVLNAGYAFQARTTADVSGKYDVKEAFAEVRLPILADLPFADELTVTAAGRIGDYSTAGETETWKADIVWAPIPDIRLRGGKARTVRAPNIVELFSPLESFNARPIDPCDEANIGLGNNPANRLANCRADGIPAGFTDPLTAQFAGLTGGNPDLEAEISDSYTYGVVLQPRFAPGLAVTVDYFKIEIANAIQAVDQQDIVDSCYDGPSLNNIFCSQFTRNRTPGPTFLGFNSIITSQLNFAGLEASGVDFGVTYNLGLETFGRPELGRIVLAVSGSYTEDRNDFPFAADPTQADPVELEIDYPEWAVNVGVQWDVGDFSVTTASRYLSEQAYLGVEIEDAENYVEAFSDDIWIHDASVQWQAREDLSVRLGIQNLTDEEPYLGSVNTPVSGVGRTFFLRFTAEL